MPPNTDLIYSLYVGFGYKAPDVHHSFNFKQVTYPLLEERNVKYCQYAT